MKTNKTTKKVSSLLIFLIIFSLILSLSTGCQEKEVSTETGTTKVTDPDGDIAFYAFQVALFIMIEGERIKDKKAKAKEAQESFNEEIESGYDFKKDFLDTLLYGPVGAEYKENERRLNAYVEKMIEYAKGEEKQDSENQNASETTVPKNPDTTQTTEKEKPTGIITLKVELVGSGFTGDMIIDFDTGAVSGSLSFAEVTGSFSGSVDLKTNTITASGAIDWVQFGEPVSTPIVIKCILASDYKSAKGTLTNGDGDVFPMTATSQ